MDKLSERTRLLLGVFYCRYGDKAEKIFDETLKEVSEIGDFEKAHALFVAKAASMPSVNIGGTGAAYASGGFVTSPTQALIGEAGAEVVIPLSAGKRARALDLFEKTAAILGGDAGIPSADFLQGVPELESFGGSNFAVDADTPITKSETNTSNTAKISMGGLNVSFTITGANDAQDVMRTIKENLEELADKVGGQLGITLGDCFGNMAPQH